MINTVSIVVSGKVQGVFFRQSTKEKASALGITGTVKNQPAGTVFIIASGPAEQLNTFIEWCKAGPSGAIVTGIEVKSIEPREFIGFNIQ